VLIKKNLFEVKQSELTTKGLNVGTQLRKKHHRSLRSRLVVEAQQMTISVSGSYNKPVQISEKMNIQIVDTQNCKWSSLFHYHFHKLFKLEQDFTYVKKK
jgi:hypothetical protein